jgi:hypothetical protein
MADRRHYPDRWNEYKKIQSKNSQKCDAKCIAFAGRYRMASSFHSASFFGTSKNLNQLYSALTQLALAFSALDMVCRASNREKESVKITGSDKEFKSTSKKLRIFLAAIQGNIKDKCYYSSEYDIFKRFEYFMRGDDSDLFPAALILHGALCGGDWAPADSNMNFSRAASSIQELSRRILISSDHIFEEFLEKI